MAKALCSFALSALTLASGSFLGHKDSKAILPTHAVVTTHAVVAAPVVVAAHPAIGVLHTYTGDPYTAEPYCFGDPCVDVAKTYPVVQPTSRVREISFFEEVELLRV
eukprot:Cvel_3236.t1-p1 / transcript=Cvel_3236.t1 / gene=Cvel_3236 / organism=Chromera_velia_CCMP2878 / gene_product=hypothetical protein / transcript_product=hypothetical protein / location=Cvel_scaffold127:554-2062(-) / protein_length=106 / sequence_SO=supercontig / SO=protein_coding / is_pseudo=false